MAETMSTRLLCVRAHAKRRGRLAAELASRAAARLQLSASLAQLDAGVRNAALAAAAGAATDRQCSRMAERSSRRPV